MSKINIQDNLKRSRLNEEHVERINMIMIVDAFSSLNIFQYLEQQKSGIKIYENLHKQTKKNSNCKNINCNSLNELVMFKELTRDDRFFDDIHMGNLKDKTVVIDNGHLINMAYLKLSNKKMFKIYMREFKHRKHNWNYIVFLIKSPDKILNDFKNNLRKEFLSVLKQSHIECLVFDENNYINSAKLKKEIKEKILYYFNKKRDVNPENLL